MASKLKFAAAALIIAGAVSTPILLRSGSPDYYRDPTRVGSSRDYDRVMDRQLARRPDQTGLLESIRVTTNGPDILIEAIIPSGYVDNPQAGYSSIDLGDAYVGPVGRIWLDHVAVAYGEIPAAQIGEPGVPLPARLFDARLDPVPDNRLAEFVGPHGSRTLWYLGMYPTVRFALRGALREEVKALGFHVFDARTHQSLTTGWYSWGGDMENRYHGVEMHLKLWHAAPIELVVDLVCGPVQTTEFAARPGTRGHLPGGELLLVAMAEDMEHLSSYGGAKELTVRLQPKSGNRDEKTTRCVFACLPTAVQAPLDLAFLDANGTELPTRGRGTDGLLLQQDVLAKAAAIETVRVKYYPHRLRLIFHLPKVPGLPRANERVDNLFAVRVPYVRIRTGHDLRELLASLAQMELRGRDLPGDAVAGPVAFENITVAELLEQYVRLYGRGHRAVLDQESLSIEIVDEGRSQSRSDAH